MVKVRVYLRRDDTNKARRVRGGDVGWPGDGGADAGARGVAGGGPEERGHGHVVAPQQVTRVRDPSHIYPGLTLCTGSLFHTLYFFYS
jgi:hypothetical protein